MHVPYLASEQRVCGASATLVQQQQVEEVKLRRMANLRHPPPTWSRVRVCGDWRTCSPKTLLRAKCVGFHSHGHRAVDACVFMSVCGSLQACGGSRSAGTKRIRIGQRQSGEPKRKWSCICQASVNDSVVADTTIRNDIRYGSAMAQGPRDTMEDIVSIVPNGHCGFLYASTYFLLDCVSSSMHPLIQSTNI